MATTYELISANTLTGNTATITLSSIPATYTDLALRFSVRSSEGSFTNDLMRMRFNGQTGSVYAYTNLRGNGSDGTLSYSPNATETGIYIALVNTSASTSNSFSSGEIYIPNYLDRKSVV